MERFSFFPSPIQNETVYSWLARYHLLSGNRSFRKNTLFSLGVHEGRPANEFPSFLPRLADASAYPLDTIIKQMAAYHYYSPFLSKKIGTALKEALERGDTDSVLSTIGVVASRLTQGMHLCSCRHCVKEDIEKYGFSTWHLSHQVLGARVCPVHHERLHLTNRTKIGASLPGKFSEPCSNCMEDRYASLIQQELMNPLTSMSTNKYIAAYYRRLQCMGLITGTGRVRAKLLRSLLAEHIGQVRQAPEYQYLTHQISLHRYPDCMFYKPNGVHHPLKHFVLIEALFEDWNEFQSALHSDRKFLPDTMPLVRTTRKPNLSLSRQAESKLRNGVSLRKVSDEEGVSVNSLKILAEQKQIALNQRPSKIFPSMERAIWRKLVVGKSTTDIAELFCVSVGAVEIILRKHPQLVTLRKRIWFFQKQQYHRRTILDWISLNPKQARQQIKSANSASYTWLYKHDKSWLYQNLPGAIPRKIRRTNRDLNREKSDD